MYPRCPLLSLVECSVRRVCDENITHFLTHFHNDTSYFLNCCHCTTSWSGTRRPVWRQPYPWQLGFATSEEEEEEDTRCRLCGAPEGHSLEHYLRDCARPSHLRKQCPTPSPTLPELAKHFIAILPQTLREYPKFCAIKWDKHVCDSALTSGASNAMILHLIYLCNQTSSW